MADSESPRARRSAEALPLPSEVALVLQGGGALGSYQAGVFEALAERGIAIDRVAGISIGAVNAAIIAGNPPELRVHRLGQFWDTVTGGLPSFPIWHDDRMRELLHELSAGWVASAGVPGFFKPRMIPPLLAPPGSPDALSFYDSGALAETLDRLVDWDLLNNGPVHFSVGAVDVESGNFYYFDNRKQKIDARHVMASGALPPGLPPVEIDGRLWWDGGLVSSTPLTDVLETQTSDLLVFQVDLFSATSVRPKTIMDVMAREKEIRFSSRTRQVSTDLVKLRRAREIAQRLLAKLPPDLRDDPDAVALCAIATEKPVSIVQLIYRANAWEGGSRDFEFSARTMREHWDAGRTAVANTMGKAGVLARNILDGRTATFDLARDQAE